MGYHSFEPGSLIGGFVIFDLIVQILSILGNGLVLLAVVNVKIGLAGYRRFLVSLLANDLFLSGAQVLIAIYLENTASVDRNQTCVGTFLDSLKLFAVFGALFNLCGMSADHLIGILMNTRFAKAAPFLIWIAAFFFGFVDIPIAAVVYYIYSYRPVNAGASYLALFEALLNSSSSAVAQQQQQQQQLFSLTTLTTEITTTSIPITTQMALTTSRAQLQSVANLMLTIPPRAKKTSNPRLFTRTLSSLVPTTMTMPSMTPSPNMTLTTDLIYDPIAEFNSLREIDVGLLQEETDWCLISYSYKLYWVQWFRLICTCVVFAFLVFCYGRIYGKIQSTNSSSSVLTNEESRTNRSCSSVKSSTTTITTNHHNSHSQNGNHGPLARRQSVSHNRRSSRKFITMTLLLLSAFAICWLPFIILEISENSELVMTDSPEFTFSRLHILQHLFNSLFLTYPLLDAIICVSRVHAVRRYISLMLLPLRRRSGFGDSVERDSTAVTLHCNSLRRQNTASSATHTQILQSPVRHGSSLSVAVALQLPPNALEQQEQV